MKTTNVFKVLAAYMIGFGICVGIIFPFFVLVVAKVPPETVLTPLFFAMCITAGILVGVFNIFLARKIVGAKMRLLSSHMKYVENRLIEKAKTQNDDDCSEEKCYVKVLSDDTIGESAKAFNSLVKSLSESIKSENYLREFTEMLSSKLELDQLAEQALSKLIEKTEAAGGLIIIEREGELSVLSSYGISNPHIVLNSDTIQQVFKDRKRRVINVPEEIYLNGVILDFKPKSIRVEPIMYKGVVLGTVVLAGMGDYSAEAHNMEMFGQGLALAFKNAITHDQLQRLAANDPLTGVFNRRFGLSRFKEEYARAVKSNQPLGVMMIDLDHFKKVNDTYGHLVGDKALINVVDKIKGALREGDVLLRYGGEEFFIVLPGASMVDVKQISERVKRRVEESELHLNNQVIKITVSIGGTSFPEKKITDYNALIEAADDLLLRAKELGRNAAIVE